MIRDYTGLDVFEQAFVRIRDIMAEGHRVIVAFSGGKDSTCTMELALRAAREVGALPLTVVMRDDEVMYPGVFEYAERVAQRPEVDFRWQVARQPILNCFNRERPYWWSFDRLLKPSEWMRIPPGWGEDGLPRPGALAYEIPDLNIGGGTRRERFPPPPGKDLFVAMGIRMEESRIRRVSVASAGGHTTKVDEWGTRHLRPIYDWTDGDVWRAILTNSWDYCSTYNVLHRHGLRGRSLRIGPPTQNPAGWPLLRIAEQAWPSWFDRLERRVPGVRSVAHYGRKAVTPTRRSGETWEDTFERVCVRDAPEWIRLRSVQVRDKLVPRHSRHATTPFPETTGCTSCSTGVNSWKALTEAMFGGDPFCTKVSSLLPYVEPEHFRPGSGTWGGKPSF